MTRGKQVMLALLSLIVLALLVMGVLWGQHFLLSVNPKSDHTSFKIEKQESKGVSSIEVAEKAVALLEEKQTSETLKVAKEAVNKLAKKKEKSSFLARISLVEAKLKNKELEAEAERAVAYLEGHIDLSNVSMAQELVAKVTAPEIKKVLEERVRLVQESLDAQSRPQALPVSEPSSPVLNGSTTSGTYGSTPVQPTVPSAPVTAPTQPVPSQPTPPQPTPSTPAVEVPVPTNPVASGDLPPANPEPIAPAFPLLEP